MYLPAELATFALSEFARGLEGLTDDEARLRTNKADGTQMNAIAWIVGHVAWQWIFRATRAGLTRGMSTSEAESLEALRPAVLQFASKSEDPTPPSLDTALRLLGQARAVSDWVASAEYALLGTMVDQLPSFVGQPVHQELYEWLREATIPGENLGTALMRCILHTWFHAGEINLVRQLLGHSEILFVGQMLGNLEWHPSTGESSMSSQPIGYAPGALAAFALSEFERDLVSLTDDEATMRLTKADGSRTNAISWIVAHVAWQWLAAHSRGIDQPRDPALQSFAFGSNDPTLPPLPVARALLQRARESLVWIDAADDQLLATVRPTLVATGSSPESVGTYLVRTVLHTWFHIGEINGIRQVLGHPEIRYVGPMSGSLEWRTTSATPATTTAGPA